MSTALDRIETHDRLVNRARKYIDKMVTRLLGPTDHSGDWTEKKDIVVGAFEIAAREMTSTDGTFLNTSHRSGHIESFRGGTEDIKRRMNERFRNHLEGRGTGFLIQQIVEREKAKAERRQRIQEVRRAAAAKAAAAAAKATAKRLAKQKATAVRKTRNQTTRGRLPPAGKSVAEHSSNGW